MHLFLIEFRETLANCFFIIWGKAVRTRQGNSVKTGPYATN